MNPEQRNGSCMKLRFKREKKKIGFQVFKSKIESHTAFKDISEDFICL